jgi:hypothetical protein
LFWDVEVTSEDEEEMIRKVAEKIHQYGLDVAAILMIESVKPLSFVGAQMGRLFVSPFLPMVGDDVGISGEKFLQIFEKHENVEKLIKAVEELTREEEEKKEAEKAKKREEKRADAHTLTSKKKGWRRLLPF